MRCHSKTLYNPNTEHKTIQLWARSIYTKTQTTQEDKEYFTSTWRVPTCKQYAYTHSCDTVVLSAVSLVAKKASLFEVMNTSAVQAIYDHKMDRSIRFLRIAEEGPRVFRRSDLINMGYPTSEHKEEKMEDIYIVYRITPEKTKQEWAQYSWNINDITPQKERRHIANKTIKLTELIKRAGIKDFEL